MNAEMKALTHLERELKEKARREGSPKPEVVALEWENTNNADRLKYTFSVNYGDNYFPRLFKVTVYPNSFRIVEI